MPNAFLRWPGLVLALLAFASCQEAVPDSEPPIDWELNLDQPIAQFEAILAKAEQQQHMNLTAANLAFVLDAKLQLTFRRHIAELPEAQAKAANASQKAWLAKRKQRTHAAAEEYRGGSLASYAASAEFAAMTRKRITELGAE